MQLFAPNAHRGHGNRRSKAPIGMQSFPPDRSAIAGWKRKPCDAFSIPDRKP